MDVRTTLVTIIGGALVASCMGVAAPGKHRPSFPLPAVKKDCSGCHLSEGNGTVAALRKPLSELCLDCHGDRVAPAEHRVGIVPAMTVKGLPLTEGKITCFTCHDPHKNPYGALLRMPETELCMACHPV